jgi:hypothetical protein
MVKRVVLFLLNFVLFNTFFVYRTLNTNKIRYKNFLHEAGRSRKSRIKVSPVLITFNCKEKQTTRGHKQDLPDRLSRDFRIHKHEKCLLVGREKEVISKTV